MENREIIVNGTYNDLVEYVKKNLLDEKTKKKLSIEEFDSISEALTDALIRYTEGIETALKSEEVSIGRETKPATWVDKKTNKSIAVTKSIREFVIGTIIALPTIIKDYVNGDKLSIVSTFLQIVISVYINNRRELNDKEMYLYSLGYYHIKEHNEHYFTIKDVITYDHNIDNLLDDMTEDSIKHIYSKLESYGLIKSAGGLYQIVF